MEFFSVVIGAVISLLITYFIIRTAVTEGINRSVIGQRLAQQPTQEPQKVVQNFSMMKGGRVVTYQKATEARYEEILRLLKSCAADLKEKGIKQWGYLLSGGEDAEVRKDIVKGHTYGIFEKDEVVGTFTIRKGPNSWDEHVWQDRAEKDALYLHRLAVTPVFRQEGIGSAALDWISENFQGEVLMLDCVESNEELSHFYSERGFESAGTYDGHHRYWKRL
ncbi:GNAT family N-acetyltransferase [Jeotgalibacillus terrae]|uniref:GNAT family N-acetyltransferase n=1 Tax=Jeotgalibacillus terrae TaxID=587735 RepID=A0ABW5ZCV4_9BACL|nr:GNAT family N-acetyltransferase [Jeotgalibacillus terrae]MBM7579074.1 GNAT superfamily N-acetyltransferase [Jeotgalibacillus terrae]